METQTKVRSFGSIIEENKSQMQSIEAFRNAPITTKARNLAAAGMILGGGLLFIMFAAQIITGMLALLLTIGVGAGSFYGLRFMKAMDPVIQQKTKNKRLEWMIQEARTNAIYQLDNQVIANHDRLLKARKARDKMGALVQQMKSKINPANKGKDNYERKQEMLNKVQNAYQQLVENLKKGAEQNQKFEDKVKEYKDMDSFATLAGQAMSLLGSSGSKQLEDMLSLESFSAIEEGFHTAIVSIEHSVQDYQLDHL